jgi:hypothetical protein
MPIQRSGQLKEKSAKAEIRGGAKSVGKIWFCQKPAAIKKSKGR